MRRALVVRVGAVIGGLGCGLEADVGADVGDVGVGADVGEDVGVAMTLVHALPHVIVGVDGADGHFLVDWGTTGSAIDATGFTPYFPRPLPGTSNRWNGFSFFGPWATVTLSPQDFSWFDGPVRQAGILGTDFLSLDAFLVDWEAGTLARAEANGGCSDATLIAAGMRPLATDGYFERNLDDLLPGVANMFAARGGRALFDPIRSRVWLPAD